MHSGELPVHGHSKHLRHQVRPQQVRDGLVVLEVGRANPDLGQQPVVLAVGGQEDGAVLAGGLFELVGRLRVRGGKRVGVALTPADSRRERHLYGNGQDLVLRVLVEETHGGGQVLQRAWICLVSLDAIQHFVVHHVDVPSLGEEGEQKAAVFKYVNLSKSWCHSCLVCCVFALRLLLCRKEKCNLLIIEHNLAYKMYWRCAALLHTPLHVNDPHVWLMAIVYLLLPAVTCYQRRLVRPASAPPQCACVASV